MRSLHRRLGRLEAAIPPASASSAGWTTADVWARYAAAVARSSPAELAAADEWFSESYRRDLYDRVQAGLPPAGLWTGA
mgnify:CR=1 FL=1